MNKNREEIADYRLMVNGLYGAFDIVAKEDCEKISAGKFAEVPLALLERLLIRGHITRKNESEELADMKLLARMYKKIYGSHGIGLVIMPTYDCNFRCPYCFEQHRLKKGEDWLSKTISDEMIESIFLALKIITSYGKRTRNYHDNQKSERNFRHCQSYRSYSGKSSGEFIMDKPKLLVKEFLAHLRRQSVSEIISDECLAAFSNVEAQYVKEFSRVSGFEIRLGNPARYVNYILTAEEKNIPFVDFIWVEIDYEQFAADKKIEPFFVNVTPPKDGDYTEFWDKVLPLFMGEQRARKLRPSLDKLTANLPEDSHIKQIGTMTGRGELDIMRIYLSLHKWEDICPTLEKISWKGDIKALSAAIETWHENFSVALTFDLSEKSVHDKMGFELFPRLRHPLLVDRFIARLERLGLCLKSKGDALRRWIRILPDAESFIQTDIHYFKLNYLGGKIIEAKAYIEQTPHLIHYYFSNYYRPLYVEFTLKDEKNTLPIGTAKISLRLRGK